MPLTSLMTTTRYILDCVSCLDPRLKPFTLMGGVVVDNRIDAAVEVALHGEWRSSSVVRTGQILQNVSYIHRL